MSAKAQGENESFLDALIALGFTIGTAGIILQSLQGNQTLIRTVGSGTNFTLSTVQSEALTKAFTNAGISQTLSIEAVESIQQIPLKNPPRNPEIATESSSAFTNALIAGGLSVAVSGLVVNALNEDENVAEIIGDGKRPVIFMTKRDNKVDDKICLPLEGTVYAIDNPRRVRIPSETHPNCVLGDTEIESDDVICAMKTFYSGPLVEVCTSKGTKITVTPNHMFLTPQGFVAADFLCKGDNIINCTNTKRKTSTLYPNNNGNPTTIKQIFDSLVKSSSMHTCSVPSTSKDLHGDAIFSKGNIHIVRPNSFLSNTLKPFFFKHFFTNFFSNRFDLLRFFSRQCTLTQFLKTSLSTYDRLMSGGRQTASFFSTRLRHTQIHGFTSSSNGNALLTENFMDVPPTTLQLIRQSLERFSSLVTLDEIIDINVRFFSGHVYDIQTPSTLYSGNGIILSNCRCFYIDAVTGKNLGQF